MTPKQRVGAGVVTVLAVTGIASIAATPILGLWPILGWSGGVLSLGACTRLQERIEASHREAEDQRKRK